MSEDAALARWREALEDWAIPDEILARASESPWELPPAYFARRADAQIEAREGIALARAEEALRPHGSVLDVGAGGGAASLPLAPWAERLVAVDSSSRMLEELGRRAAGLELECELVEGEWPAAAERTPVCDVAVCSHVLYNVGRLRPFVEALSSHARRRVVVEITPRHPTWPLNPLWLRFHGLRRPERPTWEDAVAALEASGVHPAVEHDESERLTPEGGSFEEMAAWTRRRLCLPPERDADVAFALVDLGVDPSRPETWTLRQRGRVVLWWDR